MNMESMESLEMEGRGFLSDLFGGNDTIEALGLLVVDLRVGFREGEFRPGRVRRIQEDAGTRRRVFGEGFGRTGNSVRQKSQGKGENGEGFGN
jgi:hypothetical protein